MKLCKILVVAFVMLLLGTTGVFAEGQHDFRKTDWGMTKDEVIKAEGDNYSVDGDNIYYLGTVDNKECFIIYMFKDGLLNSAVYAFIHLRSNQNDYIDDYNVLKALLNKKYGEPNFDNINWKDSSYEDNQDKYGMAVGKGHLEYKCSWNNDRTLIILGLTGEDDKINLVVVYSNIDILTSDSSSDDEEL